MHTTEIVSLILFIGVFLSSTTFLKWWSDRSSFPYTIAVLLIGFFMQLLFNLFNVGFHLELTTDVIFYVLLPLLLFESASHIQLHQFRLQFKTITFVATFGLLISIAVTGGLLALFLGLPIGVGLLFGAMISATDPIAVLAMFKSLGAPKRLALLAEGESMFNDATAVIVFRIIAALVVEHAVFQPHEWLLTLGTFSYVFVGSLFAGFLMGMLVSLIIQHIENDRIIETTLTLALALGSFVIAEHQFHMSGVIATVAAGLTLGNLGKTKISGSVVSFMNEFWEYIGFLAVTMVFFFAAFNLDPSLLTKNPVRLFIVIGAVLAARSVSTYASYFITNRAGFFKDEPDVPVPWQHVLNWGGLRGVIPLVLAYSLPHEFIYRDTLLSFTIEVFLFSLLVQGLTIRRLLEKQKLHIRAHDQKLIDEEKQLFGLEFQLRKVQGLSEHEVPAKVKQQLVKRIEAELALHRDHLLKIAESGDLDKSIRLQTIQLEREIIRKLYLRGTVLESTVFEFESELDLQEDALEHPSVVPTRVINPDGTISAEMSFRKRIRRMQQLLGEVPLLRKIPYFSTKRIILDRLSLLRARVITSEAVMDYLDRVAALFKGYPQAQQVIRQIKQEHTHHIDHNSSELEELASKHKRLTSHYYDLLAEQLVRQQSSVGH